MRFSQPLLDVERFFFFGCVNHRTFIWKKERSLNFPQGVNVVHANKNSLLQRPPCYRVTKNENANKEKNNVVEIIKSDDVFLAANIDAGF